MMCVCSFVLLCVASVSCVRAVDVELVKGNEQQSVLESIIAYQAELKTATGRMAYDIRYATDSDRETESYEIVLTVVVPRQYRFALRKDDQKELFISNGTVEWHVEIMDGDRFASATDLTNGTGKFSHITEFLPLRRERLAKSFTMQARVVDADEQRAHADASYVLLLEPLGVDRKEHMQWTHIYFNAQYQATAIQILDADNNLYDIRIQDMQYNTVIDDSVFTYVDQ